MRKLAIVGAVLVVLFVVRACAATVAPPSTTRGASASATGPSAPTSASATPALDSFVVSAPGLTAPSTTSTTVLLDRRATSELKTQHPLVAVLPHLERTFSIDYRLEGTEVVLIVTANVVLNSGADLPRARQDLSAAKAAALAWLATQGTQPGDFRIEWRPESL